MEKLSNYINGAYLDNFDELTSELLDSSFKSISNRINKNYKFTLDTSANNIYVIRLHVAYIQTQLYNPEDFLNNVFLKIESMGYNNVKDHIVFTLQEEAGNYFNNTIYKLINKIRPLYNLSNICYADEKLNIRNGSAETLKYLNFVNLNQDYNDKNISSLWL